MIMKKTLGIIIFSFCLAAIYSQNNSMNSITAYRNACMSFEDKDYGKALKYSEDAITLRKEQIRYEISTVEKSLASKEVKKAGDRIDNVIAVLEERGEVDCIGIINHYLKKKGEEFFNNSISSLLEYIKQQEEYPEAQKLIGDVYRIEGEYDFAEEYYRKALSNQSVLDIPDEKYEILYLLAEISRLKGDDEKLEVRLLNIIGNTQTEKNKVLVRAMRNTVYADRKENVNKLFHLYRTYDYYSLKAYSQLADYYYKLNEMQKAFDYSALAMLNGFTRICSLMEKRDSEYSFNDLAGFFDKVPEYSDILEWGKENSIWKNFNVFCNICADMGYTVFSMEMLEIIAFHSPEKYWQQEAVLKLDTLDGISKPVDTEKAD